MPNFTEILREIRLNSSLFGSYLVTLLLHLWRALLAFSHRAFQWMTQLMYHGYLAMSQLARYFAQRTQTVFRAHFNVIGQFTAPFETEVTQVTPPALSDLSFTEQLMLSPVVVLAWISSLVVIPPFYNAFFTLRMGFVQFSNLALFDKPNDQFHQPKKQMLSWLRRFYGLLGYLTGAFFGILTATTILILRSSYESLPAMGYILAQVMNVVFYFDSGRVKAIPLIELESRLQDSFFQRWILGIPGVCLGVILSPLAFIQAIGQVIWHNSFLSSTISEYAIKWLLINLFDSEEQVLSRPLSLQSERSMLQQYLWGFPGIFMSSAVYLPSITIPFMITKIIHNSVYSSVSAFYAMRNIGLSSTDQYRSPTDRHPTRTWVAHGFGIPGLLLGTALGIGYKISLFILDTFYHSCYSYGALSGSLLNPSLGEKPYFSGLRGDKRPLLKKLWGGLGYVAAIGTVGPVSLAVLIGRVVLPISLAFTTGILFSPFTFIRKSYAYFFETPRFNTLSDAKDPIIQKLKNLNSSLTPWGLLPENTVIQDHQNGRKGSYCFIRKTLTLNTPTNTERVLDTLLKDYRQAGPQSDYFTAPYRHTLDKLKQELAQNDFLESPEQVLSRETQINQLGQFVADYVNDKTQQVPTIYPQITTYTEVFLGYDMSEKLSPQPF